MWCSSLQSRRGLSRLHVGERGSQAVFRGARRTSGKDRLAASRNFLRFCVAGFVSMTIRFFDGEGKAISKPSTFRR
jgi:hypothetical protein